MVRPARIPTTTRATTVKVPPTAPLFPQNPVEAALMLLFAAEFVGWSPESEVAKFGSALSVEVWVEVVTGGGVAA